MDEAAQLSDQTDDPSLHFSITGGEPFLDFELLRNIVAHGHRLGAEVSCVSNAYWASSDVKARALLEQLQDAGLDLLAVSASRFHEAYVKRTRVERALRIAQEIGLRSQLKFVTTRSDVETKAEITAWARNLGVSVVQFIPLAPFLRDGGVVPEAEYPRGLPLPQDACPASIIGVDENGAASMCCTPGTSGAFFSLGNVHAESLADIRDRFHLGGKPQILRDHGPSYFARKVLEHGHGARLRSAYGDVCDLCRHIAHDPVMAPIAEASARQFEREQLRSVLLAAAAAQKV